MVAITLISAVLAIALDRAPGTRVAMGLADHVFYDWYYRNRPIESQLNGDVVILAVDQQSLSQIEDGFEFGWPWPREYWALLVEHVERAGARAVVFDILFSEISARGLDDDTIFASRLDETSIPVVFARTITSRGEWGRFRPPVSRAVTFGGVDVTSEKVYRDFIPQRHGKPSVALAALQSAGITSRLDVSRGFLLHYYGPHRSATGEPTFPAWSASSVISAAVSPPEVDFGIKPEWFKDKIVIVGTTAEGLHDIKAAPNAPKIPGVEVQATAIANMLAGRAAWPVPAVVTALVALTCAALTAVGTIAIRAAAGKAATVATLAIAIVIVGYLLFDRSTIIWLSPTTSLLAIVIAAILGISWSYFLEDRQARLLLRALETCLSPGVAAELAENPRQLAVGGRQLEMTVMFTDLAGFTSLTEKLKEKIEPALNYYLGEMSEQILELDGTLDKYIGDAIMTFWNAPLSQPDHAQRACSSALAIRRREREIAPEMAALGVQDTITRIGINSGSMFVGFTGSQRKLNYTVIGDAVNLAARLEPANKLYDTQICVAESTVTQARDRFLFRKLDLLEVKGKTEPIAVYELMGEIEAESGPLGRLRRDFERALEAYLQQNWDAADSILLELATEFPEDGPSKMLQRRIGEFREAPPPSDWDGVYHATTK